DERPVREVYDRQLLQLAELIPPELERGPSSEPVAEGEPEPRHFPDEPQRPCPPGGDGRDEGHRCRARIRPHSGQTLTGRSRACKPIHVSGRERLDSPIGDRWGVTTDAADAEAAPHRPRKGARAARGRARRSTRWAWRSLPPYRRARDRQDPARRGAQRTS